ncbi:helix-turn-helix domain-containing protein [Salipiger sp. PrR002]|uniref:helix-turn-helix domain-containing protein n=1 Tax=Salipiger sp. PrR002 TaxID=2706489 RepID=UPI0013B9E1B7|nr:helix-turn-helix domain-containing protein [Salipiger sp. PrR002]NDW00479.1 helix-turn-helix domain-containing protein [Salipiger sp. PrR002]NDW56437.1 helix-turn-helix domain-containing protein [Salipiger sp. PrR004]
MTLRAQIPQFDLFGETGGFPDTVHCERIWDRARLHDWVISAHRHAEITQVFFMRKGHAEVQIDGQTQRLDDGQFLLIPVRIVHGFEFTRLSEGLVLSFPAPVLAAMRPTSPALSAQLSRPVIGEASARFERLAGDLLAAFSEPGPFRANLLVALAHAILAEIGTLTPPEEESATGSAKMQALDRLIAQHMATGWRAGDYASALSITPGHLTRLCHAATGLSASRYIEGKVMTEASRMLAFTQIPVAEIGYRLGFSDPAYFSRRFRALRGQSPSDYRARFVG